MLGSSGGTVIFLFLATFTIASEDECSGPVERETASGSSSVEAGSPQSTGGDTGWDTARLQPGSWRLTRPLLSSHSASVYPPVTPAH